MSLAEDTWGVLAMLLLAGLANTLVQPAVGCVLGAAVAPRRLSLASGFVGAAMGGVGLGTGMVGGLLGPALGWRGALVAAGLGLLAIAPVALLARVPAEAEAPTAAGPQPAAVRAPHPAADAAARRVLRLWIVGGGLGMIAANGVAAHFVPVALDAGLAPAAAGLLFAGGGIVTIAVRVLAGALADLRPAANPLAVVAMMVVGSAGLAAMVGGSAGLFVIGAVVVMASGWGWTGLIIACAIRLRPADGTRAGAGMQLGIYAGAAAGPLLVGVLSDGLGIGGAVAATAAVGLVGAGTVLAGARLSTARAPAYGV